MALRQVFTMVVEGIEVRVEDGGRVSVVDGEGVGELPRVPMRNDSECTTLDADIH